MVNRKYILLGIFISFMIMGLLIMLLAFINQDKEIYIKDLDRYTETVMRLKNRVDKLDNNTCKMAFNRTIDRINDTHFNNGKVKIKEYYEAYYKNDETFLDYYQLIIDDCNMENNDKIYGMALSAYSYPNQVKNNYYLSYELHIEDLFNNKDMRKEEQEINSFTTKYMELVVLDSLLGVLE